MSIPEQEDSAPQIHHSVLNSSFPVLLLKDSTLFMSEPEFQDLIKREVSGLSAAKDEINTIEVESTSVTTLQDKAPFIAGLERHEAHHRTAEDLAAENKALTENLGVTNISSKNRLVDLFYDLGENTEGDKLKSLLEDAWRDDPLLTLKIIFNARSIHLGKSNKVACYKALGWLAETHPLTLLANLRWFVRPVISKKPSEEGKKAEDDDIEMITVDEADPAKAHDVKHGGSHGYWKDLLNLVVFAANDELKYDGNPASLLNQHPDNSKDGKRNRLWDPVSARETRHEKRKAQHERVQSKLSNEPFYRALHLTVARLFAEQLKEDKALLDSGRKPDLKKLSLAAKWAPTFGEFHDKHTFIVSSIAEILFPNADDATAGGRELYLREAREHYRKEYTSALRKALSIVERDIVTNNFENIKYDRVPSIAMDRYSGLFLKKDYERFADYVKDVAKGTSKISGATLLPSTLVSKARKAAKATKEHDRHSPTPPNFVAARAAAEAKVLGDVINGQWKTLIKRVRDAGTLQSSLAVCDVSGSMSWQMFKDKSCPMDSAIGLALLIAEVTAEPFGGGFISFHESPKYLSVGGPQDSRGLIEQVKYMLDAPWGGSTDFVAIFEDLILPMAVKNSIKPEDMVKQVFVFSDMQFNSANSYYNTDGTGGGENRWTSSYERIKQKYAEAGYEVPRLIFWNLAAHSTDKPTTMDDVDTALVSGYSQGMLKAFLETGAFDEVEEIETVEEDGDTDMVTVRKEKKKLEPITVVKKAVEHKAYSMLEVVD